MSKFSLSSIMSRSFDQMIKEGNRESFNSLLSIPKVQESNEPILRSALSTKQKLKDSFSVSDPETKELSEWLGRLKLLYAVPFNYLVPNEELLPLDSIRFFYVDRNWIAALLDGAYSIGSNVKAYALLDDVLANGSGDDSHLEGLHAVAGSIANILRQSMFKESTIKKDNSDGMVFTGFLLRSEAVSNWPGLEVDGFKLIDSTETLNTNTSTEKFTKLKLVRMDRLSSDILLCIFSGEIDKVEFHTPAEELHFGFDSVSKDCFSKTLKDEDSGKELKDLKVEITKDMYRNNNVEGNNVINVSQLAKELQNKRKKITNKLFSPDKFSLQMTVGVDTAVLLRKQD